MVSYNQEKYVREALDSVLMQKTNFSFEIIISDDCSKDNTPVILQEYAATHPTIVKPIFGQQNLGYPNNQRRSLEAAQGIYIALCDSDDYWTDSYKLQKQVDYMESHPECAICFHNVMNVYDGHPEARSLLNPLYFPTELTIEDMLTRKWFLPTNSELFRREFLSFPDWYDSVLHIDYVLNLLISQHGTLHYMPDVMAVYRHTAISVSAQHHEGEWGYMLFHSQTMKTILEHMYDALDSQYHSLLDRRIAFYDEEIRRYEKERYYDKHPIEKWLRPKTYKRIIKNDLRRMLGANDEGGGGITPILTVCVRSFNQSKYIAKALDSVLMQRTDFDFEIVISDDCSTDGTIEILHEYQSAYPEIIRLILGEKNIGGPLNLRRVIDASQARYITCLDGDDFYTDCYKLQKQVEFLETHVQYSACFHNTWQANSQGDLLGLFNAPNFAHEHSAAEFIKNKWFVPIHSAVIRRQFISFPEGYETVMNDDYLMHLMVVRNGAYYYIADAMVAYRHHEEEISMAYHNIVTINTQLIAALRLVRPYYDVQYHYIIDQRIAALRAQINEERRLQHPVYKWFNHKTYTRWLRRSIL